jgi:hypothetical protein
MRAEFHQAWVLAGRVAVGLVTLGNCVACGGETAARNAPDASSDAALDARSADEAPGDAGADAGPSCADLADAAKTGFEPIQLQSLACRVDEDCTEIYLGSPGWCIAPCGVLTNQSSVGTLLDAAARLCSPFRAQGCPPPLVLCITGPPTICAGETCAVYDLYASQVSPALVHGACAAFQLNYQTFGGARGAPHDLSVTLTASNGTLYSDVNCAVPLTTGAVTIPAGAMTAPFGFVPAAAGLCWIFVEGVVSSWMAE